MCKHEWKVLDKTNFKAAIESIEMKIHSGAPPKWMFNSSVMVICVCNKCGKIKKYVYRS